MEPYTQKRYVYLFIYLLKRAPREIQQTVPSPSAAVRRQHFRMTYPLKETDEPIFA